MVPNRNLFSNLLFLILLCSFANLSEGSKYRSFLTVSPLNCLPTSYRTKLQLITENVEYEIPKQDDKPDYQKICSNDCNQKGKTAIKLLNDTFTQALVEINKQLDGEIIEDENGIVVKCKPQKISSKLLTIKKKSMKKIRCRCIIRKIRIYGSKNAQLIIRKIHKEISKPKIKNQDIDILAKEICEHPKFAKCIEDIDNNKIDNNRLPSNSHALHRRNNNSDLTEKLLRSIQVIIMVIILLITYMDPVEGIGGILLAFAIWKIIYWVIALIRETILAYAVLRSNRN